MPDADLPDFDSMSQDELIAWLEQISKSQSESAPDAPADGDRPLDASPPADGLGADEQNMLAADDNFPLEFYLFEDDGNAPTAALDWLETIAAEQEAPELPAASAANPPESLEQLLPAEEDSDALEWLQALESGGEQAAADGHEHEVYELDETGKADEDLLAELDDESRYSLGAGAENDALASLIGERAGAADDGEERKPPPKSAQASSQPEQASDLDAWYADRLRAVVTAPDTAEDAPAAAEEEAPPSKAPPPGLAAAIYSARGKVEANALGEALAAYESLLRSSAGLEWVVADLRALITKDSYSRNPAVHRVLGDALARQGNLDAAIAVYRHALSLL